MEDLLQHRSPAEQARLTALITRRLRDAAPAHDLTHADVMVFTGGAENWLATLGIHNSMVLVGTTLALPMASPLFKYLDKNKEAARQFVSMVVPVG